MPKVSVLMSVYNSEGYLKEAIDSVLAQTFIDFEFLILNDASTDGSKQIILSYNDKRIHLVDNSTNLGLAASLNKGLALARGEYIARMDADDICCKQRLKKQVEKLDSLPQAGVCGSWFRWIKNGKKGRLVKTPVSDQEIKAAMLFQNPLAHPTVMIRASVLKEYGITYREDFFNSQDYALWLDLMFRTCFVTLPEVLLYYRLHKKQVSANKSKKESLFVKQIHGDLLKQFAISGEEAENKHHRLFMEDSSGGKKYLFGMMRYLVFLIRKNRQTGMFPGTVFAEAASRRWFSLCRVQKRSRLQVYFLYRKSSLSACYKPPFMEKMRFLIKSLLAFFSGK